MRPAKPLAQLTPPEQELCQRLTDPAWPRVRRIEQERIPLKVARAALARTDDPVA